MAKIEPFKKKIRAAEITYLIADVKGDIKILAQFLNTVIDKLNEVIAAVNELKEREEVDNK